MQGSDLKEAISELVRPVVAAEAMELVDVQLAGTRNRRMLRIFIDKPGGVTLDDCENISTQVGALLDLNDLIEGSYTLEVSSPGLDRPLKSGRDFCRALGRRVRVELSTPMSGRNLLRGRVVQVQGETITLEEEPGDRLAIPLDAVARARVEVEF